MIHIYTSREKPADASIFVSRGEEVVFVDSTRRKCVVIPSTHGSFLPCHTKQELYTDMNDLSRYLVFMLLCSWNLRMILGDRSETFPEQEVEEMEATLYHKIHVTRSRPRGRQTQQEDDNYWMRRMGTGKKHSKQTSSPTRHPPAPSTEPRPPINPVTDSPTKTPTLVPTEEIPMTETPQTTTPGPVLLPTMAPVPDVGQSNPPSAASIPTETSEPTISAPTDIPPTTDDVPSSERCEFQGLDVFWTGLGESVSSDAAFRDPTSYQCRALQRLTEQVGYQDFSFSTMMQYWVLYCIYFATNRASLVSSERQLVEESGDTWVQKEGWEETTVDPCAGWHGVVCDRFSRVTDIDLSRNSLQGIFPPEIRYLSMDGVYATGAGQLQTLRISNNEFLTNRKEDDDEVLTWISELGSGLRVLNYGSTGFRGPLPQLPLGIEEFDCSYALHSGVIPDSLFVDLNDLTILIMDGNNFVSSIPTSIATLPKLQYFYIRDAGLTGDLSYLYEGGMPSLVEHLVDGNRGLSGSIPSSLGSIKTLRSFSAADCSLVRPIDSEERVSSYG